MDEGSLPVLRSFVCPITQDLMADPVTTADGHVYERKAIEEWLQHRHTSPVTGESLHSLELLPEPRLRRAIEEYMHLSRTLASSSVTQASQVLQAEGVTDLSHQVGRLKEALQLPDDEFRTESTQVVRELEVLVETLHDPSLAHDPIPSHCSRCVHCGAAPSMEQHRELVCLAVLQGHDQHVNAVAMLPENKIVSGSGDGAVKIWDLASRRCCFTFTGHLASVSGVTRLGSNHVVSCSWDSTIRVWSLGFHQHGSCVVGNSGCRVHAVAAISSSSVVSGSQDGHVSLWDVERQSQVLTMQGHTEQVLGATGVTDHLVVSCSGDRSLKFWDLRTKRCTATLQGHGGSVRDVTTLAGNRLASGSTDGSIKVWDMGSQRSLFSLHGHVDSVWSVVAVGVGRLASGGLDRTIRLWDLRDIECQSVVHGHSGGVSKVATAGTNLVSSSLDHTVRLWSSLPVSTL